MIVIAHWRNHHIITLHVCKRQRHRMRIFECSYFQISTYFHITLLASKSRCLNHQNLLISQNCTGVPYGTGLKNVWYLVSALVNSTVFVECVIGGHLSMVDLINSCFIMQHFHLASERERSCYCHLTTPNERDDVDSFFSGTLCVGFFPAELVSVFQIAQYPSLTSSTIRLFCMLYLTILMSEPSLSNLFSPSNPKQIL